MASHHRSDPRTRYRGQRRQDRTRGKTNAAGDPYAAPTVAAGAFLLDVLEDRRLLAVSLGNDGWSVVTPSADSRVIYVSSSAGDDANDGLSPATAVASLARAKALVRDGMPDHLLLKRGDVWHEAFHGWQKSGRSPEEPLLIGAYGAATDPRPLLLTGAAPNALLTTNDPLNYLYIIGIEMTPGPGRGTANPTGLMLLAPADTLHVEDTVVRGYANNVTIRGAQGPVTDVTFRRSQVLDAHGFGTHAQGLYAYQVHGLTLEENLFDHNGWSETVAGAPATVYNHNAYIKENVTGFVARRNVFARAASHGLQARGGGIVEGNLFLDNPIGLSFGFVNGSPVTPGGVTGTVAGNAFLGGRDIGGSPRGWAIEVSNTAAGKGGTFIEDNVFAHDTQNAYAAIRLHLGSGVSNPAEAVGINELTVRRNTVYGWHAALWTHGFLTPGGTGEHALNDLVVADNDFRQALSGRLVQHDSTFSLAEERWSGNRYWDEGDPAAAGWFEHGGVGLTPEAWRALAEPTALLAPSATDGFPDPTRDVGSYMSSLGGGLGGTAGAGVAAFLGQARLQSAADWRTPYTARPVVDYVRQGFGLQPLSPSEPPPSPPPPLPDLDLSLTFATYLGGGGTEQVRDVAIDGSGNLYVAGGTSSGDFPTTAGAYDRTHGGSYDAFVAKFDPAGRLLWSTLLGGGNYDRAYALEVDDTGVYVAGRAGAGFPTTPGVLQGAFAGDANPNALYGQQDGFVAKLAPDGGTLLWGTYVGDAAKGFVRDLDVDGQGRVYVAFTANEVPAAHLVTAGAWQTQRGGGSDGIVAQLAADGGRVLWGSYVGGSGYDLGTPTVRVDDDGYVYAGGFTNSTDLPTTAGAFDRTLGGSGDFHLVKFAPGGASVVYSTYLGGAGGTEFTETHGLAVAGDGSLYVAGSTTSDDFPTTAGAYDRTYNGGGGSGTGAGTNYPGDGFVARLSADGTTLLASTYLGGRWGEGFEGVGLDGSGRVYVSGASYSDDYPLTADASQGNPGGGGADHVAGVLSGDLSTLLYGTRWGGSGEDLARASFALGDGRFAVAGESKSGDLPTLGAGGGGAYQPLRRGSADGTLALFTPGNSQPTPAEVEVWHGPLKLADGRTKVIPFGTRLQGSPTIVYPFTIRNTGDGDLTLGGIVLNDNVGFEVARHPPTLLAPGASAKFYLRMPTDSVGEKRAVVSFVSSDGDESPFDFTVTGAVTTLPPEIQVFDVTGPVADGAVGTLSFGTLSEGDSAIERTFTVRNGGGSDLYVKPVQLLENTGFEVVRQPYHYLTPGGITSFVLRMRSDVPGLPSALVTFGNTDDDESAYDFRVAGSVLTSLTAPIAGAVISAIPDAATSMDASATDGGEATGVFSTRRIGTGIRSRDRVFDRAHLQDLLA